MPVRFTSQEYIDFHAFKFHEASTSQNLDWLIFYELLGIAVSEKTYSWTTCLGDRVEFSAQSPYHLYVNNKVVY